MRFLRDSCCFSRLRGCARAVCTGWVLESGAACGLRGREAGWGAGNSRWRSWGVCGRDFRRDCVTGCMGNGLQGGIGVAGFSELISVWTGIDEHAQ